METLLAPNDGNVAAACSVMEVGLKIIADLARQNCTNQIQFGELGACECEFRAGWVFQAGA